MLPDCSFFIADRLVHAGECCPCLESTQPTCQLIVSTVLLSARSLCLPQSTHITSPPLQVPFHRRRWRLELLGFLQLPASVSKADDNISSWLLLVLLLLPAVSMRLPLPR